MFLLFGAAGQKRELHPPYRSLQILLGEGIPNSNRSKRRRIFYASPLINKHLLCHHGMSPNRLHEGKGAVRKGVVFCLILR
jgi:hypothetical protein